MIKLASKDRCTGCMACADACSRSAISYLIAEDGHYYPLLDKNKCIDCGLCLKACPLDKDVPSSQTLKTFAAWSDVDDFRKQSSSGGIFPTIAKHIIESGGYVIGVNMENSIAKHIAISKVEDIALLQGSKYQQSNSYGIYNKCKNLLKTEKPVLFSGTPCQVAGLHTYLKRPYPNLITIDVICAGVPSKLVIDRYKSKVPNSHIISYRDKKFGWIGGLHVTSLENGTSVRCSKDGVILGNAVAGHQTDRYSCFDCKFARAERSTDITIGDFGGGEQYFPEQKQEGLSVLLVRSEKGKKILDNSGVTMHKIPLVNAIRKNPRIIFGKSWSGKYRIERVLMKSWIKRLPYSIYASLYAGVYTTKLQLPIKLYRWLLWKADIKWQKKQVAKVITKYNEI